MALDAKALNKFSRQNAALGAATTAQLLRMRVAVWGLRGVGIEVAKNLTLQGAGGITLIDNTPTTIQDIGQNFFLTSEDIGTPRAIAVAPRLRELNPLCDVQIADDVTASLLQNHSALVVTDKSVCLKRLMEVNELCRSLRVGFFYVFTGGVCLSLFVDLGAHHVVNDADGERPVQKLVVSVSGVSDCDDVLLIRYETPEGQQAGSIERGSYEVNDVVGLDGVNGKVFQVTHAAGDPAKTVRITIPNAASLPPYQSGGILTEQKVPQPYPMECLATRLKDPGMLIMTDMLTFGEVHLHAALYGILVFEEREGRLPNVNCDDDAAKVVNIVKELVASGVYLWICLFLY